MMDKNKLIVGLDVGTRKICAAAGKVKEKNEIDIIAATLVDSHGLKEGVIVEPDRTREAVEEALEKLKELTRSEIYSVFVTISGVHLKGASYTGAVNIPLRNEKRVVGRKDIERAIENARIRAPSLNREVIYVSSPECVADHHDHIPNPLGMAADSLKAEVFIITGLAHPVGNLRECINNCDCEVLETVPAVIASSFAICSESKDVNLLIDIGAGTTSVLGLSGGRFKYSRIFPFGGADLTRRVAADFNLSFDKAEELKLRYGSVLVKSIPVDEKIVIPGNPAGSVLRKAFCRAMEPKIKEMLFVLAEFIERCGFAQKKVPEVIITGGTSLLEGVLELAQSIIGLPVRLGTVKTGSGGPGSRNSPVYSAGIGLVYYGFEQLKKGEDSSGSKTKMLKFKRIKEWLEEYF